MFFAASLALCLATLVVQGPVLNPWTPFALNFLGNGALFFGIGVLSFRYFDRVPVIDGRTLAIVCTAAASAAWAIKIDLGGPNICSSLVAAMAAALLIRNLPDRLPRWANVGFFSYSIYIFAFALTALLVWALSTIGVDAHRIRNPFAWLLAVPPVLLGCFLLYWVTERVSNRWVRNIRRRTEGRGGRVESCRVPQRPVGVQPSG